MDSDHIAKKGFTPDADRFRFMFEMFKAAIEKSNSLEPKDIAYALEPPNEEDDKKISEKQSAITTEQEKAQGNTENIDMNDKNEEQPIENSSDSNTAEGVLEPQ